jgi:hypothetical protein
MAFDNLTDVTVGSVLTASRYNEDVVDNMTELAPFFGAWTSWTPTVSQTGARTITNQQSRFLQVGKLVNLYAGVTITNAGSAGDTIVISLPVAPALPNNGLLGSFWYVRTTGIRYVGSAIWSSVLQLAFLQSEATAGALGGAPSFATANGDLLSVQFTYEAA